MHHAVNGDWDGDACFIALSISLSGQPPPLEALRCSIIDSFSPKAARGDGLPKSRQHFFLENQHGPR